MEKTRVFKKKPAQWAFFGGFGFFGIFVFFVFFVVFFGFFEFFFTQKREFLGFFSFKKTFRCIQTLKIIITLTN